MKKLCFISLFVCACVLLTGCGSKDKYTTLCENVADWVADYQNGSKTATEVINLFDSEYNSKCLDTEDIKTGLGDNVMSYNSNKQCDAIKGPVEDSKKGKNSEIIANDIVVTGAYCRRFLDGTLPE